MKKHHLYRYLLAAILMLSAMQTVQAQEAFYIYRNDGNFNGFFFNEVERMGFSKFDLDSIEHDVFVIQEIQTADSLYRIPLSAIDSIGFQQPELIFNEKFYDLTAEDCPYKNYRLWTYRWLYSDDDDDCYNDPEDYILVWETYTYYDSNAGQWVKTGDKYLPRVGDILYHPDLNSDIPGIFIGKVKEIQLQEETADRINTRYHIICDPIDDIGDIFEQFITVEKLGTDENGNAYSRMAGMDKIKKRVSDSKDLTLVNLNGSFPFNIETDNFSAGLSLDLALTVKATVSYKIGRGDWFISLSFAEDFEVGATLSAQGKIEDEFTWQVGGVPFYFPTFLPILQVKPGPGAFLKTDANVKLDISTPKLALHGRQNLSISGEGISGSKSFFTGKDDEDNNWSVQLSLNGSAMAGVYTPFRIETNNWFKKIGYCATGVDVYAGPKLSASFTLDPVALAENKDPYSMFSNTQVQFTPKCFAIEGKAIFSAGGKKEKEYKLFTGEANFGQMTLNLFPKFEKKVKFGKWYNWPAENSDLNYNFLIPPDVSVTIYPTGNSLPWPVGVGVYNAEKELCYFSAGRTYSVWDAWTEDSIKTTVFDGTYTVCPMLDVMGVPVPVFSAANTITVDCPLQFSHNPTPNISLYYLPTEGTFNVGHVLNKDDAIFIEYEDKYGNLRSLGCELLFREPAESEKPEFFQQAVFRYKLDDEFFNNTVGEGVFFQVTVFRGGKSRTVRRFWTVLFNNMPINP